MRCGVELKAGMVSCNRTPSISVVMPVHNALPFLDESIESILNQTFTDFELVILDDASTDGSGARLREWALKDERIRLFEVREQLGLSGSSNFVVRKARASVIARMDADDISHADRLTKQWEIISSRPGIVLVGTLFVGIDVEGRRVRQRDRWPLTRRASVPPFPHGSVMFRREIFEEVGGYREDCIGWEDHDLFLRMRKRGGAVVLTDALYHYRFRVNSSTGGASTAATAHAISQRQRCLAELRRGSDCTGLLNEELRNGHHRSALAQALYLRGSTHLWAGDSPQVLKQIIQHKSLGFGPRSLKTLVWATWCSLSPGSLRFFLRAVICARDLVASYRVKDGGIYEWRLE